MAGQPTPPPFLNHYHNLIVLSRVNIHTHLPPCGRDPPGQSWIRVVKGKILLVNTDARFKVTQDVGKIDFFIDYEVDGDTSKHSLQSSTYGRDQEWVLLAPAP